VSSEVQPSMDFWFFAADREAIRGAEDRHRGEGAMGKTVLPRWPVTFEVCHTEWALDNPRMSRLLGSHGARGSA
jgi:hypothetical protein